MRKVSRFFGFTVLITVIGFLLILGACSTGSDDSVKQSDFYFSWKCEEEDTIFVITSNKLKIEVISNGSTFEVSPITWKAVTNTNPSTKGNFPKGYEITGTVSDKKELGGTTFGHSVGDSYDNDMSFFIHTNKKSIIQQENDNSWYCTFTR